MLGATQAGYNDIGILTAPDGPSYAVAVMIKRTATPLGDADDADEQCRARDHRRPRGAQWRGLVSSSDRRWHKAARAERFAREFEGNVR